MCPLLDKQANTFAFDVKFNPGDSLASPARAGGSGQVTAYIIVFFSWDSRPYGLRGIALDHDTPVAPCQRHRDRLEYAFPFRFYSPLDIRVYFSAGTRREHFPPILSDSYIHRAYEAQKAPDGRYFIKYQDVSRLQQVELGFSSVCRAELPRYRVQKKLRYFSNQVGINMLKGNC